MKTEKEAFQLIKLPESQMLSNININDSMFGEANDEQRAEKDEIDLLLDQLDKKVRYCHSFN